MNRKTLSVTIRILICLFLIYFIVTRFDVAKIIETIKEVNASVFFLVLAFYCLANLFVFMRWVLIMKYMEINVKFLVALKAYFSGVFVNFFLPTSVGGDVFKAYYVFKGSNSRIEKSLFSVFFDRYVGLLIMLAYGGFFSLFLNVEIKGIHLSWILFAVFAVFFLISVFVVIFADRIDALIARSESLEKRFSDTFKKISDILSLPQRNKSIFLGIIGCSLAGFLMLCLMHYTFIYKVGHVNIFMPILVFVPVTILSTMIPISLNGIGIREIVYAALFQTVDVAPSVSIAMSVLFYSVMVIFSIPGAFYFFRTVINKEEIKV